MLINKDSSCFGRASAKALRISPKMYRPKIEFFGGRAVVRRSVVGTAGNVYYCSILSDGISRFDGNCDCPAGLKNSVCYHLAAVYLDYQKMKRAEKIFPLEILPFGLNVGSPVSAN